MLSLSEKIDAVKIEFDDISYSLDERRIRLWCAAKAKAYNRVYGKGGVTVVHKATDVSRPTIYAGLKEIESEKRLDKRCIRNVGGGRKKITEIGSPAQVVMNFIQFLSKNYFMSDFCRF